jgi:hypothetical protein
MVLREGFCSSSSSSGGGGGGSLAGDERLEVEDLAPLGGLGSLWLDVGVGEAGGGDDEGGAGEEEAGRGGGILQPHHLA